MAIRVAIVEDQDEAAACLAAFFKRYSADKGVLFELTRWISAEQFLTKYDSKQDLVLMDIMLTGMNGMEAAARLRRLDQTVTLVFVTNMAQFAVKGYEVDAFDFIVKPVTYPNFALKMDRVLKKIGSMQSKQITIRANDGIVRLPAADVLYVEVDAHNLIFHTDNGTYTTYDTMKHAEELFSGSFFFRCNNCYLVNMDRVRGVSVSEGTVMVGSEKLSISRARRKKFLEELNRYLGENV